MIPMMPFDSENSYASDPKKYEAIQRHYHTDPRNLAKRTIWGRGGRSSELAFNEAILVAVLVKGADLDKDSSSV